MANVLPEVRPSVESMPHEGFVMQTGGSARRSIIKNDGSDTYHVHGVPGHTHNASAMISVTADYTKTRTIEQRISQAWAQEDVVLAVGQYTDSVEPEDAAELYDRAIERGIGTVTLIPENCQHSIREPVRSISEIRTIVSAKDRRDTLTYVNNEFGWVDPTTGEVSSSFNREPIQVNFYGYPSPLLDRYGTAIPHIRAIHGPTMRHPVYIGSRTNISNRYAIIARGSDTPNGEPDWDGNVPFTWDEDTRTYRSQKFSKFFTAQLIQTVNTVPSETEIGRGPTQATNFPVLDANAQPLGGANAGQHISIAADQIHVRGVGAFKLDSLDIAPMHAPIVTDEEAGFPVGQLPLQTTIERSDFKVTFEAYATQPAQDGFCVLSRQPNECIFSQTLTAVDADPNAQPPVVAREGSGFSLVPDLPVEVHFANNKITNQPFWFGPPAYRIAVGGRFALPGPARDKLIKIDDDTGGGNPGNYDDAQDYYFNQIEEHSHEMETRTFWYGKQFMELLTPDEYVVGGGLPNVPGDLDTTRRTIDLNPANVDTMNLMREEIMNLHASLHGGVMVPANAALLYPVWWSTVVSSFHSAPYMFVRYTANRQFANPVPTHPNVHEYFRRGLMDSSRRGVSGMDEWFKFEESPYLKNMYYPSDRPALEPTYTCDGRVNRPFLRNPIVENVAQSQAVGGPPHNVTLAVNPYNHLVAAPLATYLITSLIIGHWAVNNAPTQVLHGGLVTQHSDIFPQNWNANVPPAFAYTDAQQTAFMGDLHEDVFFTDATQTHRYYLTIPTAAHPDLFRVNATATQPQFDDDAHNIALDLWRRHYTEWIHRSLHTFGEDDAFTPAFDYGHHDKFSIAYDVLEKEPHTDGGYRIYSNEALLRYRAPLIVTDPALANPNAAPPPPIETAHFTYLMDHVKMTEDERQGQFPEILKLEFEGDSTPIMKPAYDGNLVPDMAANLNLPGYEPFAHYTAVEMFMGLEPSEAYTDQLSPNYVYHEEAAGNFAPDSGFTTVSTVPTVPCVQSSRIQGNRLQRRFELGNYFVVAVGPTAARSEFERTDPGNTGAFTHVEFRNFYWNWGDDRNMYLLFNNYGVEREHARQEGAWANTYEPIPLAFHFKASQSEPVLVDATGNGDYEMRMRVAFADLIHVNAVGATSTFTDGGPLNITATMNCAWDANVTERFVQQAAFANAGLARAANSEREITQESPTMCLFVPGRRHNAEFMSSNYESIRQESVSHGLVHRVRNKISQHLCAPILNPDTRLGCIAPLNHDTRHLPPEMRDFTLRMSDVNFDFLETTQTPTLNEIVLSEFNGGVQNIAASESLLYLPNFKEFKTPVAADRTFEIDCYSGNGVPAFVCAFCRAGPVLDDQPLITELSFQNRTTMKKSNTIYETNIHELFHMTQRNVHKRSEYAHAAFNKRQTLLLATEDIGIMGLDPDSNYQQQKRVILRISGKCTSAGQVTIIFIYNNRGLYLTGVQQSVVRL